MFVSSLICLLLDRNAGLVFCVGMDVVVLDFLFLSLLVFSGHYASNDTLPILIRDK